MIALSGLAGLIATSLFAAAGIVHNTDSGNGNGYLVGAVIALLVAAVLVLGYFVWFPGMALLSRHRRSAVARAAKRSDVTITSARWWGKTNEGEGWCDVRHLLQDMLDHDGMIDRQVDHPWLGDPAYGFQKWLEVEYVVKGDPTSHTLQLAELQQLTIP